MTQPTERRFVMEPRLDAEVETLNTAIDAEETARIAGDALKVAKAGDTMTGALTLNADPTNNLHAATKQYVDNVTINTDNLGDIDYIQFDTTYAGGSTAPGMLAWDQDNETLEFMLDDHVTLQVGQEHVLRVKNNSGSVAIPERTVVMFAGAAGDTIKVSPAVSDGTVNVNYLAGITTEEIPADGFGFVTQLGFINQVNTNAWPVGTLLYVDPATPGGLTSTEPESPAWTMPVAAVTKQNVSAGRMLVRCIPGGSGAGGGASVNISDTAPVGGNPGDMWYDSTDGTLYVYYEDVDGSQWVQVQANSALTAGIESRVGALESQAIAMGAMSPNLIINGDMSIAQRGTSFTYGSGSGARYYTADRWSLQDWTWSSGSNITVSNDTSVIPSGVGINNSSKVATGATGLTFGSTGFLGLRHVIEGYNLAPHYGRQMTLSFYVRSSTVGTYTLLMTNGNSGLSPAPTRIRQQEYTITAADTWERKTIVIDMPVATASGSWDKTNGYGLELSWILGAHADRTGNNYQNIWGTYSTNVYQTSSSVQWATGANKTFYLTGVQLEAGTTATAFRRNQPNIASELATCQRYYQFSSSVHPLQVSDGGLKTAMIPLRPEMRTTPTFSYTTSASVAQNGLNSKQWWGYTFTAGEQYIASWTANAEL